MELKFFGQTLCMNASAKMHRRINKDNRAKNPQRKFPGQKFRGQKTLVQRKTLNLPEHKVPVIFYLI